MIRFWSKFGVRTASVALLATGLAGGVYLGQHRDTRLQHEASASVVEADAAEITLLKDRQNAHAAARASRAQAELNAAGKAATAAKAANATAKDLNAAVTAKKKAAQAAAAGPVAYAGPIPSSCNEYSGSRQIGCALLLDAGFALSEFPCLNSLFNKESGWNYRATNRSSGAYGIPQALPGSKMSSAGADWKTSPATQIKWGLGYIKDRYDTPCKAWSHSESVGSY
ncbi:lytic transglycosylase domain-containing protein [Actinoplanes sp. NPDC051851]|uniref:aggregation-promoting factor C-terminal-like domain-containing protein n=1 Tax=Actinoplanes sp. NPDC051851 TaxID=3154753 RepID=UPI0034189DBD